MCKERSRSFILLLGDAPLNKSILHFPKSQSKVIGQMTEKCRFMPEPLLYIYHDITGVHCTSSFPEAM